MKKASRGQIQAMMLFRGSADTDKKGKWHLFHGVYRQINHIKRYHQETETRRNYFFKYTDKGFVSRITKEFLQLSKTNNPEGKR